MKPTKAQLHALKTCEDHVTLIVGGIDDCGIRLGVIYRCRDKGWLKYKAPSSLRQHSEWKLTKEGWSILDANK